MAKRKVSPEEMRDELLEQLYENRGELRGIALVQGIKALRDLIPPAPPPPPDEGEGVSLLDKLDALPAGHARGLLRQEIKRLEADLVAHQDALKTLGG